MVILISNHRWSLSFHQIFETNSCCQCSCGSLARSHAACRLTPRKPPRYVVPVVILASVLSVCQLTLNTTIPISLSNCYYREEASQKHQSEFKTLSAKRDITETESIKNWPGNRFLHTLTLWRPLACCCGVFSSINNKLITIQLHILTSLKAKLTVRPPLRSPLRPLLRSSLRSRGISSLHLPPSLTGREWGEAMWQKINRTQRAWSNYVRCRAS